MEWAAAQHQINPISLFNKERAGIAFVFALGLALQINFINLIGAAVIEEII